MEKKGHKFYKEGAEKIKNSLGRKMLNRLAEDELIHIKRIKDQMDEAVDDLSEVGVDDEEIINVALELESHAKLYYLEAAKKSKNEKVKHFYEMLAKEEKNHYDLLVNTNKYLENPSLFFGMGYH